MRIRRARISDLPLAKAMLSAAGLPVADLAAEHLAFAAADGERVTGMIGIELHGHIGLLRSLVIAEDARSEGLGRKLVAFLEAAAREDGIAELWLLTTDAAPYFAQLGYETRERSDAPEGIRGTAEFADLCPGDATLMCKPLG